MADVYVYAPPFGEHFQHSSCAKNGEASVGAAKRSTPPSTSCVAMRWAAFCSVIVRMPHHLRCHMSCAPRRTFAGSPWVFAIASFGTSSTQ